MEKDRSHICAYCHGAFDIWDTRLINRSVQRKERRVCTSCAEAACNDGRIVQCDACGELFTSDVLHDEEISGHTFTACPICGKDVVECLSREDFESEHLPCRYAVIVRSVTGEQRGYIVSVDCNEGIGGVFKKLAEKVNLDGTATVTVAEVLLKADEFLMAETEPKAGAVTKTVLIFEKDVDGCGTNVPVVVNVPHDASLDQLAAELGQLKAAPDAEDFSTDDYVETACRNLYGVENFGVVSAYTLEF